ncbi:penicillin acylase family protein [Streptomyces sp. NPDC056910]|uniref:penicillin acylase family protein n=1 Tax=Streptomyces sp. NPDC056910 TaxID=3345964 RepID=UPI0036B21010
MERGAVSQVRRTGVSRWRVLGTAARIGGGRGGSPSGAALAAPAQTLSHQARGGGPAARVAISRDERGIPHIVDETDAGTVFGMLYAQAEDDFNRIERNYLFALGRLAVVEGECAIWQDLRQRLYLDPESLKKDDTKCPEWLQRRRHRLAVQPRQAEHPGALRLIALRLPRLVRS